MLCDSPQRMQVLCTDHLQGFAMHISLCQQQPVVCCYVARQCAAFDLLQVCLKCPKREARLDSHRSVAVILL